MKRGKMEEEEMRRDREQLRRWKGGGELCNLRLLLLDSSFHTWAGEGT